MKVTQVEYKQLINSGNVEYKQLINSGNYEHQSLSVIVVLEDDETAHEAVARARKFVQAELKPKPTEGEWASAKKILENPDQYRGFEVKQAQQIAALCEAPEEIPF